MFSLLFFARALARSDKVQGFTLCFVSVFKIYAWLCIFTANSQPSKSTKLCFLKHFLSKETGNNIISHVPLSFPQWMLTLQSQLYKWRQHKN